MLIYNKTGKLVACTSDDALCALGYESVKDFFNIYDDLSEIFIPKVGYIAAYDGFSWVAFLFNDILPQNRVLVSVDSQECEFQIDSIKLFSLDGDSIGVTFQKCDSTTQENLAPQPTAVATDEDIQKESDVDDELMQLLNLSDEETVQETVQEKVQEKVAQEEESSSIDDLDQFKLDFDDIEPSKEEVEDQKEPEEKKSDDDLYDLDLDFSNDEDLQKVEEDSKKQEPKEDAVDFDLDLSEEPLDIEKEEKIEETLSLMEDQTEAKEEFEQYIDSAEYKSSKEVDLENLSNELGLELEESANFIYDFTTMIKAKEELLSGANAAIEAASLKNIAENFRLFNIVKTLESIENGEPNSALLFSQIEKLQKELSPYAAQDKPTQVSTLEWESATKQQVEFNPGVAAESLGLPTELISEFVNDFVEQAKESKDIFDNAYAQKDIATIKETAHKLKGAAANLRIEPIASKLEELQYNEDLDAVPAMLIEFWGMYHGLREVV